MSASPSLSRRSPAAMNRAGSLMSPDQRRALAKACERAETFTGLAKKWQKMIERYE